MSTVVVDTNVAVVANGRDTHAAPACISGCCARLLEVTGGIYRLAIDSADYVFEEYRKHLSLAGQPGPGDLFMKWLHTNRYNSERCRQVDITAMQEVWRRFAEVPDDPDLAGFDADDQVFVAVSRASTERPPILNAVDSDWWDYEQVLSRHGVQVEHVCDDEVRSWRGSRRQRRVVGGKR